MFQKAKPILFNTEMVQALLDGRKSCTRRLVKPQPCFRNNETGVFELCDDGSFLLKIDGYKVTYDYPIKPLYYKNDILYVRETWGFDNHNWLYKADFSQKDLKSLANLLKWRPSIHMPKKAARIFLRVTNVRVERLQDITEEEALSEGIYYDNYSFVKGFTSCREHEEGSVWDTAVNCFRWHVWNKTLDKSEHNLYGWDANPWVWVYDFEVLNKQ